MEKSKIDRFRNKYRIPSTRAPFWDYRWKAAYFVTICTKNRACWFGEITNGVIELSEIGKIVKSEWLKTFKIRPDMNLWMGKYVVMPNHFHAIIGIGKNQHNSGRDSGDRIENRIDCDRRDAMPCVSTNSKTTDKTTPPDTPDNPDPPDIINPTDIPNPPQNKFGPQSKNLGSVIRGFKTGVTKNARIIDPEFSWQKRYHDHIIRDEDSLKKISDYIIRNPVYWQEDHFFVPY